MRVTILKKVEGVVDGVSLGHLIPGLTYDLPKTIALWLMERGAAEEMALSSPALVIPLDNAHAFSQLIGGVSVMADASEAADAPKRTRRTKKR